MIKVLAADDEPLALRQLESYISKIPFLELSGCCTNARQAIGIMKEQTIDAIFLDISMPGMSGMELASMLADPKSEQHPLIVFTTAYQEFAIDGYKVNALDYLLKPFSLEEFTQTAVRLRERFEQQRKLAAADTGTTIPDETLFFKTGYKIVRIQSGDIFYIESMSEYMKIHTVTAGRRSVILVLNTMTSMLAVLPPGQFMRIHRSYIINLSKLDCIRIRNVSLTDGTSIPIGDSYKQQFREWLDSRTDT